MTDPGKPSDDLQRSELAQAQKVHLFLRLFRGREDVYPIRFEPKPPRQPGYVPDCANRWVEGVCDLPRVKCGDCSHQAFRPVDERAVLRHLRGQHVMGVYPMLPDGTCWFLAADFDEGTWQDDVRAVVSAASARGLPCAVERSRSGNGGHVWFFFSAPVSAASARAMGRVLFDDASSKSPGRALASYDRLFPSQDTMPKGGFGNLIALPLQRGPRSEGNSVFLNDDLLPIPDAEQWAYLAKVARIEPGVVSRIAREAKSARTKMGRPAEDLPADDSTPPWTTPALPATVVERVKGPLPERIAWTLAGDIFVSTTGLSPALLSRMKRLATFANPEFYKRQKARLSTARTPRNIDCSRDLPQHLALPRGCREGLETLLTEHDIASDVTDRRAVGHALSLAFRGTLTDVQSGAAEAMLAFVEGVFVAPPGTGKTVLGAYLVAARGRSTLVLVHRKPLLDQWVQQLAHFLALPPSSVGRLGGAKSKPTGVIDVAMIQSLGRPGEMDALLARYGHIIVDECHHLPAAQFEQVLRRIPARYVVGLTATPQRRDGHQPITQMCLGPVRHRIKAKDQATARGFAQELLVRDTNVDAREVGLDATIQDTYAALAGHAARNAMIVEDVNAALRAGRSPLVLTERRDHLEHLATCLRGAADHVIVLRGGMGAKGDRNARAQLLATPAGASRLVLATGRYIGEGFDDARLDTLFLTLPVAWKGTLEQYAGRLHRRHPGKAVVRVYDYVDRRVPVLAKMFAKRLRAYRAIGYAVPTPRADSPPDALGPLFESYPVVSAQESGAQGVSEPPSLTYEYDEDVLRCLDHESATDRDADFEDDGEDGLREWNAW